MQTGKVTGYEITKNKGSEKKKLILQLEISDPEDIQSIQLLSSSGEISNPPNGSKVISLPIGTNGYKVGIAVDDNIEPEQLEPGDKIIYSSKDGVIKGRIYLKNNGDILVTNDNGSYKLLEDGTFEVNGNDKSFVTFDELDTALDNFKTSIETSIKGSVDAGVIAHTHISNGSGVPTNPGVGSIPGATPSVNIDISDAETTTVKTGG